MGGSALFGVAVRTPAGHAIGAILGSHFEYCGLQLLFDLKSDELDLKEQ